MCKRVLLACPVRVSEQLNLARLLHWTVEPDETPQCPMMLWIQSIRSPWHRPRMPGPVMAATICHQQPVGHVHVGFVPPRRCCRATRLVCQSMSVALAVACRSGRRRLAFSLPGKSTARDDISHQSRRGNRRQHDDGSASRWSRGGTTIWFPSLVPPACTE